MTNLLMRRNEEERVTNRAAVRKMAEQMRDNILSKVDEIRKAEGMSQYQAHSFTTSIAIDDVESKDIIIPNILDICSVVKGVKLVGTSVKKDRSGKNFILTLEVIKASKGTSLA